MSSTGLWSVVGRHAEATTLAELAELATKGPADGPATPTPEVAPRYVLGINASQWVHDCLLRYQIVGAHAAQSPHLEALFKRLSCLLQAPLIPLFVFDGPDRPRGKYGRLEGERCRPLARGLRQLLIAFGYPWYKAKGDADAELARLNAEQVIDAVMSDDSRAVLFGARVVVRNRDSDGNYGCNVAVYRVPPMSDSKLLFPSRGALLLSTLLTGDEFNPAGLEGFPPAIGHMLACSGLGDSFLEAALSLRGWALQQRLARWRDDLRAATLHLHPEASSRRARRSLTDAITDAFPPAAFVGLYTMPVTSWSSTKVQPPTRDAVSLGRPNLQLLTLRCEQLFGWEAVETVCDHFRPSVWAGVFIRDLQASVSMDDVAARAATTSHAIRITANRIDGSSGATVAFRVRYSLARYVDASRTALESLRPPSAAAAIVVAPSAGIQGGILLPPPPLLGGIWVPMQLLRLSCPALVDEYEHL